MSKPRITKGKRENLDFAIGILKEYGVADVCHEYASTGHTLVRFQHGGINRMLTISGHTEAQSYILRDLRRMLGMLPKAQTPSAQPAPQRRRVARSAVRGAVLPSYRPHYTHNEQNALSAPLARLFGRDIVS